MKKIYRGIDVFRKKNDSLFLQFTIILFLALLAPSMTETDRICDNEACKETAISFLKNMDETVDPCQNFYEYACGNFVTNTKLQEHEAFVDSFSTLEHEINKQLKESLSTTGSKNDKKSSRLVKKLYRSCMNIGKIERIGLSEIINNIKTLGGWPVVDGDSWNDTHFDWLNTTRASQQFGYKSNFFFTIDVRESPAGNDDDSLIRTLHIRKPSFYLNSVYLEKNNNYTIDEAYLRYITSIVKAFGAEIDDNNNEMSNVLNFMKNLTKISRSSKNEKTTISGLERKFPDIPWLRYITAQMPENLTIHENTLVKVNIGFISGLELLLGNTSKRTIANYIMTELVTSVVPFLNNEVRRYKLDFDGTVTGITKYPERWQECIEQVKNKLPIAISSVYVREHFSKEIQPSNDVGVMLQYLRQQFVNMILQSDWMDFDSQMFAIDKINRMSNQIGYPEELLDDGKLDEYYKDLELSENSYLGMVSVLEKFNKNQTMAEVTETYNKHDWKQFAMRTTKVNAYYGRRANGIVVPAATMHGAFFNKDRPFYVNYGSIGAILGHEISHAFGPTLIKLDKDGKYRTWVTYALDMVYNERIQCIADQYSDYLVKDVGLKIDGHSTVEENFADIVGITVAYGAYSEWAKKYGLEKKLPGTGKTPKQLFWLSIANSWCTKHRPLNLRNDMITGVHAPPEARIIFSFKNNPDFAKDFNCKLGSNMNPVHKCTVF